MKKGVVHQQRAFVASYQSSEVAEPCESSLYDPSPAIATQFPPILRFRFLAIDSMWRNKINSTFLQFLSKRITICRFVVDQSVWFFSTTLLGNRDLVQRFFDERDFRGGRRAKVVSQRNTFAVDHHHPLRALAPLGFPDCVAPFLAGAKLPSMKHSLHFNCFRSSSWARYARQIFSHVPSSSQSLRRRQQVDGLGKSSGRSFHRAPVRRIHRIPSKTRRLSAQGRPPFFDFGGLGNNGSILRHILSLRSFSRIAIGRYLRPFYVISKIAHV